MLVTRDNFEQIYPSFVENLAKCDFVSFDLEMSGINNASREQQNAKSDDPDTRYLKMVGPATRYAIIQYGICLWTSSSGKGDDYRANPYCFFLFPNRGADLVMQADSIAFLRGNNMDFGTWITKGVPYVDRRQAGWLKERHTVKELATTAPDPSAPNHDIVLTKPMDIEFMNRQKAKLAEFLADAAATSVQLETCNNYLKKCTYQYLERNHPELTLDSVKQGFQSAIVCRKLTDEERKRVHDEKVTEQLNRLNAELGFTRVYNALCESKKPIVGHNCFFDCLFTLAKMDGTLPGTLHELTLAVAETGRTPFYQLIDTKYLVHSDLLTDRKLPPNGDTQLGVLYAAIAEQGLVKVKIEQGIEVNGTGDNTLQNETASHLDNTQLHDAGYDAYVTGHVFAHMLGDKVFQADNASSTMAALTSMVDKAAGRLFMMQSLYHMDLRVNAADTNSAHGWIKEPGSLYFLSFESTSVGEADIYNVLTATGVQRSRLELLWSRGVGTSVIILVRPPLPELAASSASTTASSATSDEQANAVATPVPVQDPDANYYMNRVQLPVGWEITPLEEYRQKRQSSSATTSRSNTTDSATKALDVTVGNSSLLGKLAKGLVPPLLYNAGEYLWSSVTSASASMLKRGAERAEIEREQDAPSSKKSKLAMQ